MKSLRRILTLALCGLLLLTSQTMAMMRAQDDPVDQIVLCTGFGAQIIAVDENGEPVGPKHLCPDCVLTLFSASADTPRPVARLVESHRADWLQTELHRGEAPSIAPFPRGPPLT